MVFRQTTGDDSTPEEIYSETLDGMEQGFTRNRFQFETGDFVSVRVVGVNGAGGRVSVNTTGVTVDLTPPALTAIVDGNDLSSDIRYQSANDSLAVTWSVSDVESAIARILGNVYEVREGRRLKVYPADDSDGVEIPVDRVMWNADGLELNSGSRYIPSLTFANGAGSEVTHESDGVVVDLTPPTVMSLSVGSDTYLNDADDAVTMVANPNQTEVRWLAADAESGIERYLVGVVDENGTFVSEYAAFEGSETVGLILTPSSFPPETLFRVALVAVNRAGVWSGQSLSEPYR